MCEVFFFGTAFNIPSHSPSRNPGILRWIADGMASTGSNGWDNCREYKVVDLVAKVAVAGANRGRNDESIDDVVA